MYLPLYTLYYTNGLSAKTYGLVGIKSDIELCHIIIGMGNWVPYLRFTAGCVRYISACIPICYMYSNLLYTFYSEI